MRRFLRFSFLLLIVALPPGALAREAPHPLDALIERAAREFEVPGAVVVVVRGNDIIYERAMGVVRLGGSEPVSVHTRFAIGSITKSFAAAAVAQLVDEKKLDWDDKATRYLPELRMAHDYVTRELTLRDMLSHRSGLASGAGDLLSWPQTDIPMNRKLAALRHLPLTRGFRSRYGYSNLLYAAVGEIVARRAGMSWSQYVRSRLLAPLGMDDALTAQLAPAWPHARIGEAMRGTGPVAPLPRIYRLDGDGAAGALYASGSDMARWMSVQLADGRMRDGRQLFSAEAAHEMHALQTPLRIRPSEGAFRAADPIFSGYGLGWFVRDYHGTKLLYHGGGTLGGVALVTLVPQKNIGFIILTNSEESGFLRASELLLLDHYLGRSSPDWIALQKAEDDRMWRAAHTAMQEARSRLPKGPASVPLESYAGRYIDKAFGLVEIRKEGRGLAVRFDGSPFLSGGLEHVGGDIFRTRFREPGMEDAYLAFRVIDGKVTGARAEPVSPAADFSFDFKHLVLERE
jgi:Beta-lactamase class C and other penicillin binding proteins